MSEGAPGGHLVAKRWRQQKALFT